MVKVPILVLATSLFDEENDPCLFLRRPMDNATVNRRPGSIRSKLLMFSLLATLLPSIGMGWFWYDISRETTTARVEQQLSSSADVIKREIDLWFKERKYDLRVFSNSFIMAENLDLFRKLTRRETTLTSDGPLKKISTYLSIIITKFTNYHRLAVLDTDGRLLASSSPLDREKFLPLPDNWRHQVESSQFFIGYASFTPQLGEPLVLVGIPLMLGDQIDKFFILEAYLDPLRPLFSTSLPVTGAPTNGDTEVTLLASDGRVIFSTEDIPPVRIALDRELVRRQLTRPGALVAYRDDKQHQMLGMTMNLARQSWYLVLEQSRENVYRGLTKERNRILLVSGLLTIVVGAGALMFTRYLLVPLNALTRAVARIEEGDLRTSIPITRRDELGRVSEMFNEMARRVERSDERLKEQRTTDPLTGLVNRRQILVNLEKEMEVLARHGTGFAVLVLDIDHFKGLNDTYGRQAGDSLLVGVADILDSILRTLDSAGRYSDEEFLIILEATTPDQALHVAKRIRQAVAKHQFPWQDHELKITVSIGIGAMTNTHETVSSLINRAKLALYRAKKTGPNQVSMAESD